jgi:hypothetical protein
MNKFFFLLLVLIVIFTTYAFASSQTGAPVGGEGGNPVSGYTVSAIHYQLSKDATLSAVEFDLSAPAGTVKAGVNSTSGVFFDCKHTGGYHWVCDINSSIQVSEMSELKVVATDK